MSTETLNMTPELRNYMLDNSVHEHPILEKLRDYTMTLPGARMQISPEQGQLMGVLVRMLGVSRAIEVGTFTGYSALTVALALPEEGQLVCCDISEESAAIARDYWQQAGVAGKINMCVAPALETMNALIEKGDGNSFDFAFIDADKCNYKNYYEAALKLLRPGGVVTVDNVLWYGRVIDAEQTDEQTQAIRALNQFIHEDDRVHAAMLPIGDGLTVALKK